MNCVLFYNMIYKSHLTRENFILKFVEAFNYTFKNENNVSLDSYEETKNAPKTIIGKI